MNNYESKSIVSKTEAEALKDMIFNRVKERSKALAEDVNQSYMSSVQNEVMDIARNSFVASKNPFSIVTEEVKQDVLSKSSQEFSSKEKNVEESKKYSEELKKQIYNKQNEYKNDYANNFVHKSMFEQNSFNLNKKSFVGALNFLNSQASIVLVNNNGKRFDATV
jgi:hypothetical protein